MAIPVLSDSELEEQTGFVSPTLGQPVAARAWAVHATDRVLGQLVPACLGRSVAIVAGPLALRAHPGWAACRWS